jgi:sugar (pentulose or hexulose) kinase
MSDLVLGVDCSTTASKVLAWDRNGTAVGEGRAALEEIRPRPLYSEQAAEGWWDATAEALSNLMQKVSADRIVGICITHQRESYAPVDADNHPLRNAILWDDGRAQPQLDELGERFGHKELHRRTGRGPSLTQAFPKLLWLVQNEPEVAESAYRFMDVHGFLVERLTGEWTTSLASADSFGLTDVERDAWAEDLITGVGLRPDQFCATVPPGTIIGGVSAAAAKVTGLPEGIPVVAGLGDGQAACLGAGVTSLDRASLNLGTAVTGGPVSHRYISDASCRTMYAGAPGTFLLEECLRGGMATMTWFMRNFGDTAETKADYDRYEAAAREVGVGAGGLILVPYWNGAMSPYWDGSATGIVVGWHTGHTREHLFRAIEEGISFEFRQAMNGIEAATGEQINQYVILGGGSNSELWCQIMADVLGRTVTRAHTVEATNLGAGILAAYGIGWYGSVEDAAAAMTDTGESFEPDDRNAALYDTLFNEVYTPLFPAIQPRLQRLAQLRGELDSLAGDGNVEA